jgi:DNA mismatch endonuclease (patch repair protein)
MASVSRSDVMRAVRSRGTKPEQRVAELLRRLGVRFRRNVASLPGSPDFVVGVPATGATTPTAIFVHGCWWHGHDCARGARVPRANREYWVAKVARNRRRDRHVTRRLRALGYSVWIIWECRLKSGRLPGRIGGRLARIGPGRRGSLP